MNNSLPLFIEAENLQNLIQSHPDIDFCIVDLSSGDSYQEGHVPGAVHLPYSTLLCGQAPAPGKIASREQLEKVFSYLGLKNNTHFICYDDEGGGWAGRFIWTLDAIGHRAYSYIDGGILAWRAKHLPLEAVQIKREANPVSLQIDANVVIEMPEILAALESRSIQIWDARSPEEYAGFRSGSARAGHIPGAINCEWTALMDPARAYRLRGDARERLSALGIDGSKPIVTHCQSHHRSGFTYLVGKLFGFDIKGYHGSWAEWGNAAHTPIEK